MKALPIFAKSVALLVLSLVILECSSRVLVESVLKRPRLFRLDTDVGWRSISDRTVKARAGETNQTLILGDSFVFGEEVAMEDRFDNQMIKMGYPEPIANRGLSGYSTDQELIAAKKELGNLQSADTVVLLTFGDDFRGLLSSTFAGRPKPRFRMESEKLILIKPKIDWVSRVVDRSYLAAAVHKFFGSKRVAHTILDRKEFEVALKLYEGLISQYLAPLVERNVNVIIAFHGKKITDQDFGIGTGEEADQFLQSVCHQYGFFYLSLDAVLDSPHYRQPKGVHWNAQGHQKFAKLLMGACDKSNNQIHLSQKESR